jgi:type I restriction enzyme M protein
LSCCRSASRRPARSHRLLNATRRVAKGRPKNIPEDDVRPLAAAFLKGEPVEGEIAVITCQRAEDADYNLSPSRWVGQNGETELGSIGALLRQLEALHRQDDAATRKLLALLAPLGLESYP